MLREQYMWVSDARCAISQYTTMYLRINEKSALDPSCIAEFKKKSIVNTYLFVILRKRLLDQSLFPHQFPTTGNLRAVL